MINEPNFHCFCFSVLFDLAWSSNMTDVLKLLGLNIYEDLLLGFRCYVIRIELNINAGFRI